MVETNWRCLLSCYRFGVKVLVAGHTGLAGHAIFSAYKSLGVDVLGVNREVVNLENREATIEFCLGQKPEVVIDAAALSGGIMANQERPVDFLLQNLRIQSNLMEAAQISKVKRFVFLGSSCIYPRDCPQPIKEEYLMTGPLESTNSAYAIAKISGLQLIQAYRQQFGFKWISIMPTNLYGPFDNFNLENGHVLPALIHRFVEATENESEFVQLWGSGSPKREFLHTADLASASILVAQEYDAKDPINVGSGMEISISDLAIMIAKVVGFQGEIKWDYSHPDGTPRKLLDISKLKNLGWKPSISLDEGIQETVKWFIENRKIARK